MCSTYLMLMEPVRERERGVERERGRDIQIDRYESLYACMARPIAQIWQEEVRAHERSRCDRQDT